MKISTKNLNEYKVYSKMTDALDEKNKTQTKAQKKLTQLDRLIYGGM